MSKRKRSRRSTRRRAGGTTEGEGLAGRLGRMTAKAAKDGGLAEVAWEHWTHTLAAPKGPWEAVVEHFVTETAPKYPEHACAVLLLALDNAPNWYAFCDGRWVSLAGIHVYTYFTGSGYGDARVFHLVERFVRWMRDTGRLREWDRRRLLSCLDEARSSHGVATKGHPVVRDPSYRRDQLDELHGEFAQDLGLTPPVARWTRVVLDRVANATYESKWLVRFGGLVPEDLVAELRKGNDRQYALPPSVVATLTATIDVRILEIASCFYRWLGDSGRLDAIRADELSRALADLAAEAAIPPSLG